MVGGVPDQGVGEAHAADRAGDLRDDARLDRLVEQLEDGAALESADTRQRIEIELAAEHRGKREKPVALVREVAQAAADHLPHALRDGKRRRRRLVKASLRGEQPHDLADEQRVALGLGVHRRGQVGCGRAGRGELDEAGDVVPRPGRRAQAFA